MRSLHTLTAFIVLALGGVSYGALYQSIDGIQSNKAYDFIIAGGGTGGCAVANRLTENPKFRVLLLEAGPSGDGVLDIEVPGLAISLWGGQTPWDWNYTTVPQVGLNGRNITIVRGHVLGGSSAVNGMAYTRGSADEYDRWASVTGDKGWSWKQLFPYILKNERFTSSPTTHAGQFDPKVHNFTGVTSVSLTNEVPRPMDNIYIQASKELNQEFPFNIDMNDGTPLGLGWFQATIGNGTRSSAASSYLAPQYINRPNLDVVVNTRISRILPTRGGKSSLDLRTVEFISGTNQTLRTLTAQKEVILASGTIGTPQILLNSGIGNATELNSVGVKSVLSLPGVGKNYSDHVFTTDNSLTWSVNITVTPVNATDALNQWLANRTGPYSYLSGNNIVWGRVPSTTFTKDPSAGPNSAHYEFIPEGSPQLQPTGEILLHMVLGVVSPSSRGSVTIQSNNPFDTPLIDPGFLTSDTDLAIMKEAIAAAKRFIAAPAFTNVVLQPGPDAVYLNVTDDATLDQLIRNHSYTGYHPVGTAAMSPKGARYGVVDPDLLLKGAKGLRIVDASVMPYVPDAHTQAAVYAIAERAADLIKRVWLS